MFELDVLQIARFWMKVEVDPTTPMRWKGKKRLGHCWIWKGSLLLSGYGRFYIKQKAHRTHRIAYYIYNGNITKDKFICHRCDNPRCVNPKHLFEGTPKENIQDCILKGRKVKPGRHKTKIKKLNKNNIYSKYFGVHFRKDNKKWCVLYMINYKPMRKGQFDTEIEAAKAYDESVKEENKKLPEMDRFPLNFPDEGI